MLPEVLAGPMVRRTDRNGVWIWMAASRHYEAIEASLFTVDRREGSLRCEPVACSTIVREVCLGQQLYITMVYAGAEPGRLLPEDTVIAYNLHFKRESGERTDLVHMGIADAVSYPGLALPSFVISSSSANPTFLFGSCRKLHGKGDDAFKAADLLLAETALDPDARPSALHLIGDQIYADDVADPLMASIWRLAEELRGNAPEDLSPLEHRLREAVYRDDLYRVGGRRRIVADLAGFTSDHAGNHLIHFHEYAALYLLSWNLELWPKDAADDRLDRLRLTLGGVRRLFANVPVYMIFDDHDITDDWNLDGEWEANVRNRPLGRHIIAGGLAAYWAFQGWGNDPDRFEPGFIQAMTAYLARPHADLQALKYREFIRTIEQFDHWWFLTPASPAAIFLDTRTDRRYDTPDGPPRLVSSEQLQRISTEAAQARVGAQGPVLLVSAVPVYGIGVLETVSRHVVFPLVRTFAPAVRQRYDYEAWKYNAAGLAELLRWLSEQPFGERLILLSGDVHVSAALRADVSVPGYRPFTLIQLISSAIKNISFTGILGLAAKAEIKVRGLRRLFKIVRYGTRRNGIRKGRLHADGRYDWKDEVRYVRLDKRADIVYTNESIGLAKLREGTLRYSLLSVRNDRLESASFRTIDGSHLAVQTGKDAAEAQA